MKIAQADGVKGSEETLKRKGRTKFGCWMMGCASPIGLILLLVLVFFIWRAQSVAAIAEIEAEITARGEPLNVEEVNQRYRDIGDAKNKTALLQALFNKLNNEQFKADYYAVRDLNTGERPPVDPETPWPHEQEVADFFTKYAELLDKLEAAALAEGEVRFTPDFAKGCFYNLPEEVFLRRSFHLLDLRAEYATHVGDSEQAFRSILASIRLAATLHAEPDSDGRLTWRSYHGEATARIAQSLPWVDWTDAQIKQLIEECLATDGRAQLASVIAGDRAIERAYFDRIDAFSNARPELQPLTRHEDERFYLEYKTRCLRATDLPFPELLAEIDRINSEYFKNHAKESAIDHALHDGTYGILSMFNFVNFSGNVAYLFARAEAIDQATAAQLAIELYQREHGEPPTTLSDLVPKYLPEEPIDPFSGLPLVYTLSETEIIVYSVGENGVADDGAIDENGFPLDEIVRVLRK